MSDGTVKQIIPAIGWNAIYLIEKPPYYCIAALAAWALVVDEEFQWVEGMDGDSERVERAQGASNFYVYVHGRDISAERKSEWKQAGREEAERKPK